MSKVTLESLKADYKRVVRSIHSELLTLRPDQILSDCKQIRDRWYHIPSGEEFLLEHWTALNLYAVAVRYKDEEEGLRAAMLWKLSN